MIADTEDGEGGNYMAKKRKAKRATIKRGRTAKKSKRTDKAKRSKLKKKSSKPNIDIFRPDIADEELERAAGSGRLESVIPGLAVTNFMDCCR